MTTVLNAPMGEAADASFELAARPLTIHERMTAILAELPALGKDSFNEQQRFHYRAHDDVLNALNPLLAKYGVYVTPDVIERVQNVRTTASGKAMYEVNLHVRFTFHGEDGSSVTASGWGEGTDLGDKATNKAMTGAFKYVLFQTFAISTAEASDADDESPEETMAQAESRQAREERATPKKVPKPKAIKTFDPGKDLLPGAIRVATEEDAVAVRQGQRDLDPTQPWADIEAFLCAATFEKPYDDLSTPEKREFWTRLANAVVKVNELAGPGGDFPPPTSEQIREGYAWAFKGVTIAFSEPLPAAEGSPDTPAPPAETGAQEAAK